MADQSNEMGMVRRVAEAIYCALEGVHPERNRSHLDAVFGPDSDISMEDEWRAARAAIEAMREPSEEMKKRWLDLMEDWVTEVMPDTYDPYRAMIDEALKPAALSHDEVKA